MDTMSRSNLQSSTNLLPSKNDNILSLPPHIQVEILSHLSVYDQLFGAMKTCKYWEKLLVKSQILQRGRYPGYSFPGDSKVFDTHGGFSIAAGYFFKAKVEDGKIVRYFYDDAGRGAVADEDMEIYHVYEHPTPPGTG
ncbi:hypothetical protein TWF718_008356 [Orbilia javanica]|uniref:F-box domain-containing protein n=1 Tax=Orbilia javanica TaxID=47235 RepID=A0AAN8MY14_9PEZI